MRDGEELLIVEQVLLDLPPSDEGCSWVLRIPSDVLAHPVRVPLGKLEAAALHYSAGEPSLGEPFVVERVTYRSLAQRLGGVAEGSFESCT